MSKVILLEGIDGSGKTTLANMIVESLKKTNDNVYYKKDPGSTVIGEKIRDIVLNHKTKSKFTALLLFTAARMELAEEIVNNKEDCIYVLDRWCPSTYVYQGRELNETVILMFEGFYKKIIKPEMTFFIDVSPENAISNQNIRKKNRDVFETYDNIEEYTKELDRLRSRYLDYFNVNGTRIDGNRELNKVFEDIIYRINKSLAG